MTAISEKQITDALDAIKRNIESAVKKSHTKHGDDAVPEWEVQLDGGRVAHVYYLRAGFNLGVDTEAGFEMMASLGTYHVLVNDDGQDYVPSLKLADEILHKFMERFTKGVAKTGLKYRVFDLEDAIYEVRVNASVLAASA